MIKFLRDGEITGFIRSMIAEADRVDLAVAFWGRDAEKTLGIDNKKPIRILCDLQSGACNPDTISLLESMPNVKTRMLKNLHAKVYWTPTCAVVGSANASANGLAEEGSEIRGTIEAAVCTDEQVILESIHSWLETKWKASAEIDEADIEKARVLWKRRRAVVGVGNGKTILQMLREDAEWFQGRRIRVIAYEDSKHSESAEKTWQTAKGNYYDHAKLTHYENSGTFPFYEDETGWSIEPSDYIIDYFLENPEKPKQLKFGGMWRVRQENAFLPIRPGNRNHRLILLDEVKSAFGLNFPIKEAAELRVKIANYLAAKRRKTDRNYNYIDEPLDRIGILLS